MFRKEDTMVRVLTRERRTTQPALFVLEAPFAKLVSVAGSFNNWNPKEHPMKKGRNGTWSTQLSLTPGTYEYKFVVDGSWQEDPRAEAYAQNPFGTRNALFTV